VRFIITAVGCALTLVPLIPLARLFGVRGVGIHSSELLGDLAVAVAAAVIVASGLWASRHTGSDNGGRDFHPRTTGSSDGHAFDLFV
jgi:hypothetical protein